MTTLSSSSTNEEIYAFALRCRDHKVEGLNFDDSSSEAEKLFLLLAKRGISKAMHNYASIQHKKGNFELAFEFWSKSDLPLSKKNCDELLLKHQVQQDLFLVAGSDRMPFLATQYCGAELHGNNVDMTHLKTFGGKAITMDILPSHIPNAKHIIADVTTYDFAKNKFNIKHALLERLPTARFEGSSAYSDIEAYRKSNVIGKAVLNVAKAMQPGAILEIEWDPFSSLVDMTEKELNYWLTLNPFHGFRDSTQLGKAVVFLSDPRMLGSVQLTPEDYKMVNLVRNELELFVRAGVRGTVDIFLDRIMEELTMLKDMKDISFYPPYPGVLLDCNYAKCSSQEFVTAARSCVIDHKFRTNYQEREYIEIPHPKDKNKKVKGLVYHDTNEVLNNSMETFVTNSISAQMNVFYVLKFMSEAGFEDVTVQRRTNEHNGRKNVWMVRAVKV